MKVLVCGSRGWSNVVAIFDRIGEIPSGATVITGGAKGADRMAAREARLRGDLRIEEILPDWTRDGKLAGILRNLRMLDERPDLVLAFWDGESRGTKHTISEAQRRGIPVEVITCPE